MFLKKRSAENELAYIRQRNYCVSLIRKSKKNHYSNIDNTNVIDSKLFWKSSFFSDKGPMRQKITLLKKTRS